MMYFREACCTSLDAVFAAERTGARRIELCERLEVGGVTPSEALLRDVLAATRLPVNVLVRPRGGDFVYDEAETQAMLESIRRCRAWGANGVVIGALTPSGAVDVPRMRRLLAEARPLSVTFHRAFDETADPLAALETVIALGCDRLLTSGHAPDALAGRALIGELVRRAAGRLSVMAGCGVRPANISDIARDAGVQEFHSSCISDQWI
ncbi:MAG: copper homeostasis protein CutC [Bacteroidales bacterium]|nr:copper homeostasis protein CutC [Bacteroidales bacterium]